MLCSHHIEVLNNFTFEFVFCKQSLMGHYMCPELGPLAPEGSGSRLLCFPDTFLTVSTVALSQAVTWARTWGGGGLGTQPGD